jgi:hypothetical protein
MRDAVLVLVPIIVWLFCCYLVGRAASAFHRLPANWFLLALFLSPLAAFVLLLLMGDAQQALALREKEERIRQRHPEWKDLREAALNEMQCPRCGAEVNPITGDGLHSSEIEPWRLVCDQCQGMIEPDV